MAPIPSTDNATGISFYDKVYFILTSAFVFCALLTGFIIICIKEVDENYEYVGHDEWIEQESRRIQQGREGRVRYLRSDLIHFIMNQPEQKRVAMRTRILEDLMELYLGFDEEEEKEEKEGKEGKEKEKEEKEKKERAKDRSLSKDFATEASLTKLDFKMLNQLDVERFLEDWVNSDEGIAWGENMSAGLNSLRDF